MMKESKILKWEHWPLKDQETFIKKILTQSPASLRQYIYKWEYWLALLQAHAPERLLLPIAQRPTDELIDKLIEILAHTNSERSIGIFLHHLYSVAVKMSGPASWDYLRLQRNAYRIRGGHVTPTPGNVSLSRLMEVGYGMMNEADEDFAKHPSKGERFALALLYRDGLLLAFAASFLMRLRNVADQSVPEDDLPQAGERWIFELSIMGTKAARSGLFSASPALSARLTKYVSIYRSLIPNSKKHDGLWASRNGTPMSPLQVYKRICRATGERLDGHHVNLRQIRRIGATAFAGSAREEASLLKRMLTQGLARTGELHYNLGGSHDALQLIQNFMMQFRREAGEEEHSIDSLQQARPRASSKV